MPSLRAFFTNMSAPIPLRRKLYLVFRNNLIKILKRQSCCGHPGEPGCWEEVKWLPVREDCSIQWRYERSRRTGRINCCL